MIGGLVLAADRPLNGGPALQRSLSAMLAAPVDRIIVVLGAGDEEALAATDLRGAEAFVCERWEEGRSAALACGLAELAAFEAVVVTLGDQQDLPAEAIERVVIARGGGAAAVCATYGGEAGYPVLYEQRLFERLRNVTGDRGARNVLMSARTRQVPCDDLGGGENPDAAGLDELLARRQLSPDRR